MDKETKEYGCFAELVLLSPKKWEENRFIDDIETDWGMVLCNSTQKDLVFTSDCMRLQVSIVSEKVPDNTSDPHTAANRGLKYTMEMLHSYRTSILIAVSAESSDLLECGKLLTKTVSSCLKQGRCLGVYIEGAVFDPSFYIGITPFIRKYPDALLIPKTVCLGIHIADGYPGIYTYGMRQFGKEEMEIYANDDLSEVREFLLEMVLHILDKDIELQEGTNMFSFRGYRLNITLSDGIAVDGKSLKIEYPQRENIWNC
ncbi:DUF4261 domain-containing protein [Bacteroides uniformis]|uniref:DUF4261 domain-containing protein n=1 Tax=Bacteroides uniformis TaxID=820 RepID=UPI00397E84D8